MAYKSFHRKFPAFRRKRMSLFVALTGLTERHSVIDVGGTPEIWKFLPFKPKLTFVNLRRLPGVPLENQIICDGCDIPVPDKSFDIAFSNSVIEHVGSRPRQADFARELNRVGRSVWLQTPDRACPLEVHTLVPFLHWLPDAIFVRMARQFSIRRFIDDPAIFETDLQSLHPLSVNDVRVALPAAKIIRERLAFFPKSIIAYQ